MSDMHDILLRVDRTKMFDTLALMNGDTAPVGRRLAEALLASPGFCDRVGLAFYGIEIVDGPDRDRDRGVARLAPGAGPFLICDLRPDWNAKPYVSFWRPNNANYAYPLCWAGDYTGETVLKGGSYYTTIEAGLLIRFPLARDIAEALAVAPRPGVIDGDAGPVIRNTPAMRRKLRGLAWKTALDDLNRRHAAGERA